MAVVVGDDPLSYRYVLLGLWYPQIYEYVYVRQEKGAAKASALLCLLDTQYV